jgi:hypothetical protein
MLRGGMFSWCAIFDFSSLSRTGAPERLEAQRKLDRIDNARVDRVQPVLEAARVQAAGAG